MDRLGFFYCNANFGFIHSYLETRFNSVGFQNKTIKLQQKIYVSRNDWVLAAFDVSLNGIKTAKSLNLDCKT